VAVWKEADALPRAGTVPVDPEDRERVTLAVRHPRRVDVATVGALADVLAATRRLEDQMGSAAVLPGVRNDRALARSLLADARGPVRDRAGALVGELRQYLGWLLIQTRHPEQAQRELDAALALGVEFDDPDLTSLALSYKSYLAWMVDDPQEVIALSRAARRDQRVFVAQHAYNAYQEARGWAMVGERAEVDRLLGRADELAERAVARHAEAPPNMYWYSSGFFTLQRGFTWHTLKDVCVAQRAVTELITGLHEMPAAERDSEWAAIFVVAAAEAYTTAGDAELAIAHARQALVVCHATRSTRRPTKTVGDQLFERPVILRHRQVRIIRARGPRPRRPAADRMPAGRPGTPLHCARADYGCGSSSKKLISHGCGRSQSDSTRPPSAISTAASASTRPRSWTGTKPRRTSARDKPLVRPDRSAMIRSAAAPTWLITSQPAISTVRSFDHEVNSPTGKVLLDPRGKQASTPSFSQARSTFLGPDTP
jgi:hypothetical protein